MVFAVGIGFVPSINFFFLGGCPLEKGRSQMSWWRRWGKRREYTILLQLFQSAAESYAERSSSPGCLWLSDKTLTSLFLLLTPRAAIFFPFLIRLFDLWSMWVTLWISFQYEWFHQRVINGHRLEIERVMVLPTHVTIIRTFSFSGRRYRSLGQLWPTGQEIRESFIWSLASHFQPSSGYFHRGVLIFYSFSIVDVIPGFQGRFVNLCEPSPSH